MLIGHDKSAPTGVWRKVVRSIIAHVWKAWSQDAMNWARLGRVVPGRNSLRPYIDVEPQCYDYKSLMLPLASLEESLNTVC